MGFQTVMECDGPYCPARAPIEPEGAGGVWLRVDLSELRPSSADLGVWESSPHLFCSWSCFAVWTEEQVKAKVP